MRRMTWARIRRHLITKLSNTQFAILGAAAQREDRNILPLPGQLHGWPAAKTPEATGVSP